MTFIINRWVRGEDFIGREPLLETIRQRTHKATWVLGNRRVGKTSLLRQIEWLCKQAQWPDQMPLFWDMQGAANPSGLKDSFLESLEDDETFLEELGLDVDALEALSFSEIINRFRRKVKGRREGRVLLLIDECEELVDVAVEEPGVLSSFRKLTHTPGLSIVMAGSLRLMDLDESASRTSPFLPDYLPPLLLGPFTAEEGQSLLVKNGVEAETARGIHELCLGNPHLLQMVGEHLSRAGNLDDALSELLRDKVLHYFYKSNFQCLPEELRNAWTTRRAADSLRALTPDHPHFPYAEQASLLCREPDGMPRVAPLLILAETGKLDRGNRDPAPAGPETHPTDHAAPAAELVDALVRRRTPLAVLPVHDPRQTDQKWLEQYKEPPNLSLMASLGEPAAKIHEVLDGASPEYVHGKQADARTLVYLTGLWLYRRYLNASPFADIGDPWQRAGAIGDRDVPLPRLGEAGEIPGRTAMVLLRALKARPEQRYADTRSLLADLGEDS